jgi:tetratricopeptide (TPR) repeat protein
MTSKFMFSPALIAVAGNCIIATSALSSDQGNASWNQATQLFKSGDYSRALPALNGLEGDYPRNEKVHYMIGVCYQKLQKHPQAQRELKWVASYAVDPSIKAAAEKALAESIEKTKSAPAPVAASTPAKPVPFAFLLPPGKGLVRDSPSETVRAAYEKGWIPCNYSKCLNYGKSGWHHMPVKGFPDTFIWMDYPGTAFSQNHIGDIIETDGTVRDAGPCPTCKGAGWIKR